MRQEARTRAKLELEVAVAYAVVAGAWIALSDVVVGAVARTAAEQTNWSILKGFGFVAVTSVGLFVGLRWALSRERAAHRRLLASEAALRDSEERYRGLFESSADAIVAIDAEGRFTDANGAALRMLGYEREELLGLTYQEITPERWRAMNEEIVRDQVPTRGYSDEYEKEYVRKDGTVVPVSVRTFARRDPEGRYVGAWAFVRDITERRLFRQSQKLESVGRLAGGVAHDFNNLLTVVLSCAESLHDAVRAGAPVGIEEIEDIRAAGERARDLTRQLLAFARRQVIAPVPLDLNALVRDTEKLLRRVLGEDVELATALQPNLRPVRCDPGQIEQVVLNLAVNARDAMPSGGRLTIETADVDVDERLAATSPGVQAGPHVRLALRDTGQGMSAEVKAHVFEPFFTTKPEGRGTGLGLATVYGIVKQNGGHVLVHSAPEQGTAFEIYFPASAEVPLEAPTSARAAAGRGNETILVVEDDPRVREVTVRSLRAGGYRVLVAGDGEEALAVAEKDGGILDLLVSDVIMPGRDGRAVAETLRRRQPDLRVLFVSGYPQSVIADRGVLASGVQLLQKPFTQSSLLGRVRAILDT